MKYLGVIVGRYQPCHLGHVKTIEKALQENDSVVVFLGSAQFSRTHINPYTVQERVSFLKGVFPNAKEDGLKLAPINDIQAVTRKDWQDYINGKLLALSILKNDDVHITYYSGSEEDALWYKGWADEIVIVDRFEDRITATDIRNSLALGTNTWKRKVPEAIHDLVSNSFPDEFRTEID